MKILTIIVVGVFLCTVFAFADEMIAELNDGYITEHSEVSGGSYLLPDDWLNPCGPNSGEDDEWCNGFAWYAEYTEEWPSFNVSFANSYDLKGDYGITSVVGLDKFEVGCMNDYGFDCPVDFFILGDDDGYPDGTRGEDALFAQTDVDTSDWESGTYPQMAWNTVDLNDYDGVWEPLPEIFFFGMHTSWEDGDFDFYLAMQNEYYGALDVGCIFMNEWEFVRYLGYCGGAAWALKLHVYEVNAIQNTSLGSIKSMF